MANHPPADGGDQRQRLKWGPSRSQRVDQLGNPFAVAECPRVNLSHSLLVFGPLLPNHQPNKSALRVVA